MKITVNVYTETPVYQPMCKGKCNGQGNATPDTDVLY